MPCLDIRRDGQNMRKGRGIEAMRGAKSGSTWNWFVEGVDPNPPDGHMTNRPRQGRAGQGRAGQGRAGQGKPILSVRYWHDRPVYEQ